MRKTNFLVPEVDECTGPIISKQYNKKSTCATTTSMEDRIFKSRKLCESVQIRKGWILRD